MTYQITVKAIRGILLDELNDFFKHLLEVLCNAYVNDMTKNLVYTGYYKRKEQLKECKTYEDLEEYLSDLDYRMSLEDWVNSLGNRWDGNEQF